MNDGDYLEEELHGAVEDAYIDLTYGKKQSENPRCYILGGQPGAGKTGLQAIFKKECSNNLIVLNGDEFRELHPDFERLQEKYGKDSVDYTGKFSGQMTEKLAKKLRAEKFNVLIEGTLRTAEVPLKTCKEFKESGYKVTLGLIAVKPEISYLSTLLRYEQQLADGKQPRATSKDKHDYVVQHLPENLKEIYESGRFDNIVIYNRDGACLYDMSKDNTTTPDKIMDDVFSRDWSETEIKQFKKIGEDTKAFMVKRKAEDLPEFIRNVFNRNIVEVFITGKPIEKQTVFHAPKYVTDKYKSFIDPKLETAYHKVKHDVISGKSGVKEPIAIVLGGQPGAGKSNLYTWAKERFVGNIVELDCDAFRKYHPDSEMLALVPETYGSLTNPFVFDTVDRLIDELSEYKFNMIIESSMKTPNSAFQNHELLTPKGYSIEAQIMATSRAVSWQGVLNRYQEELEKGQLPRLVPKEFHDYVADHFPDSAEEIFLSGKMSNIQVYNRERDLLYDMKSTPTLSPKSIISSIVNQTENHSESEDEQMKKDDFQILVQQAREKNILDYFQESGYSIEKKSSNYYVTEIAGLCLKPESNQWYYHYENIGRTNNSIDCLTKVLNMDFNQAVYELTGKDLSHFKAEELPKKQQPQYTAPPTKITLPEKKELEMPEQSDNMRRLFAYFCKSRHIPAKIVEELVHAKLLYQTENEATAVIKGVEKTFKNANAVFIHKDDKGEIIGGEVQGLNTFKRFKGVAPGTGESVFKFVPNPSADGKIKRAYLFESAIDLMSFYSFCKKEKIEGAMLISMAGLKPTVPKQLRDQGIEIVSCVDNDDAGRKFEAENGFKRPDGVKNLLDDNGFKDWNEMLSFRAEHPNAKLDENLRKNNGNSNDMSSSIGGR